MQGSFYSWMRGAAESVAMDAEVMRKHPDGSPCYAKKDEDCPILNKAKKIDKADDLKKGDNKEKRHLMELFNNTLRQIHKYVVGADDITFSQLEEAYVDFQESVEESSKDVIPFPNSRKRRDEVWQKHKDAEYCSFSLETGTEVKDNDEKWGVTFHTTSAERDMSDDEYDSNVAIYARVFDAKPQVGVFEGACEMSYACKSLLKSAAALVFCEQKALFGYMQSKQQIGTNGFGVDIVNYTFDKSVNNLEHPEIVNEK